ncbi:MAG: restriction endonuclease subunit S, partial [Thermoproteota archaeon]
MMFYKETDFTDTPIGKIPEDWSVTKLDNLIEIETGKRAKGGGLDRGNVASIGGEHIDDGGNIRWDDMKFIPEDFYNFLKQGKVNLGDVLLVKDGATTGKVAIVKNLKYEKVAVNEHVFVIRSKMKRLTNEFLFYFLFSKFGQIQIKTRFHGMIGGIIRNDLETILIPLPPVKEQQKITEILSTVDEAIQKTNGIIAKTERLKKGLIQELLTKGIGHKEFKDSEIGRIPKEWEVVKIREVAEKFISGGTPSTKEPKYWNGDIPWIRSVHLAKYFIDKTSIEQYITKEGLENSASNIVPRGNLIIATRVGIGKAAVNLIDVAINQDLTGIVIDKSQLDPLFAVWYLLSPRISKLLESFGRGTTIKGIAQDYIKNLIIPLPSMKEQQKIAEILSTVDKKLELEKNEKAKVEKIKQGLMDLLLTGKIRVK